MPNAQDAETKSYQNILVVGLAGSGKTTLMRTLPGKKFAYLFDPNALESIKGADIEYEEWLPDHTELDTTIKGFNKGSRSDTPASAREPRVYVDWCTDLAEKARNKFFDPFDWVILDSITLLQKACHDRQSYLNNRYGKPEELADYRIVGSKISDLIRSTTSEPKNIFITGHVDVWQDETSKKITTQLALSGSAKKQVPLVMTNIWEAQCQSTEKDIKYVIKTRPERDGLQTIRSSVKRLEMYEDVTVGDWNNAEKYGIGKILNGKGA